jgi:hypothetical protein
MNHQAKLEIYNAQVKNVRSIKTGMKQFHRSINDALRANDQPRIDHFTKAYAVLFCGWAEANFSKILHTPHGFTIEEIKQVQLAKKSSGISVAWKKCVDLGLRHLDAKRGSFLPNAKQKLVRIIDSHVVDPSILRNKLAHGQWTVALNSKNDAVNNDITRDINDLNIIKIDAWRKGHQRLADLIETLIESPKKAFVRDWYQHIIDIDSEIVEAERRTLQEHVDRMNRKATSTSAQSRRRGLNR